MMELVIGAAAVALAPVAAHRAGQWRERRWWAEIGYDGRAQSASRLWSCVSVGLLVFGLYLMLSTAWVCQ